MINSVEWDWIPGKRVGPVVLGAKLEQALPELSSKSAIIAEEDPDDSAWLRVVLPDVDACIFVANRNIQFVTSYKSMTYEGAELVGISILELGALLGKTADEIDPPVEFDNGYELTAFDFDSLGLQAWVRDGYVDSVSCRRE